MRNDIPLMNELRQINNLVTRVLAINAKKKGYPMPEQGAEGKRKKLTPMQGFFISYIYEKKMEGKDVFQKDLEQSFMIRRSTATEILKIMEKNELITKESVEHDARLKKIVLTEKAIEGFKLVNKNFSYANDVMLNDFSDEEEKESARLLF